MLQTQLSFALRRCALTLPRRRVSDAELHQPGVEDTLHGVAWKLWPTKPTNQQGLKRGKTMEKPWETYLTSKHEDQYIYLETPNALEFLGIYIYIHNLYD